MFESIGQGIEQYRLASARRRGEKVGLSPDALSQRLSELTETVGLRIRRSSDGIVVPYILLAAAIVNGDLIATVRLPYPEEEAALALRERLAV